MTNCSDKTLEIRLVIRASSLFRHSSFVIIAVPVCPARR
jgi:hypothetical protein